MFFSKNKLAISLIAAAIFLSGCSVSFNTGGGAANGAIDGGIYRSENKGAVWAQKTLSLSVGGRSLDVRALDTGVLEMDPSDPATLYLGSLENGVYYSYDRGESWQVISRLGKTAISALAVDPGDKCILYAATANRVVKSVDCGRFWDQAYFDNDPAVAIRAIAVDPVESAWIFITTSRGEVIKSVDAGKTWRTVGRLESDVVKIKLSPHNPDIIFAGTRDAGVFRSFDSGESWQSLEEELKDFKDNKRFRDLTWSQSDAGTIFLANGYGFLKSTDDGDTWANIELIPPQEETVINSIAVNPKSADELYYVTNTTFYHSIDGGKNWSSKKLPTTRLGWRLIVDPEKPDIVYLGVRKR
ncbi:MAG: hypothetical protein WCW25_05270 [Patescibacteria group bacterium]|jgi:photosystem II stability/assembly factor-like uncharacterized protein